MLHRRTAIGDPRPPDDRSRRDHGSTFIELLISIVLIGTAVIAVLAAVAAAATGARVSDEISKAQSLLASAADFLTYVAEPGEDTYVECASVSDYQTLVDSEFGPSQIDVVSVEYWDSTTGPGVFDSNQSSCPARFADLDRLQRVVLVVSVGDNERSVAVLKRPAVAPDGDPGALPIPPDTSGEAGGVVPAPTPGL